GAPNGDAADRGRCRYHDHDEVCGEPRRPCRLPRTEGTGDAGRGPCGARGLPAPRGRDREVRTRDLLLQRRSRGGVDGGDTSPGSVTARRAELRPETRDVRGGGD